jgi:hypothetical protein
VSLSGYKPSTETTAAAYGSHTQFSTKILKTLTEPALIDKDKLQKNKEK